MKALGPIEDTSARLSADSPLSMRLAASGVADGQLDKRDHPIPRTPLRDFLDPSG